MFNIYPYLNVNDLNLDWIIAHFKEFIDAIANLESWRAIHEKEYQELKSFMDEINAGYLPQVTYDKIEKWIKDNIFDIVGSMIKFITVYLDDSGYICLRYPSQWNDLIFNTTGLDINTPLQPEYGHLTISY